MTYKEIEDKGLAYKYIRGSVLYGTNIEGSDVDYGGVFILPPESLMGLRCKYVEQVSDKKSDITYYELGRWVELLANGNPSMLEGLFAPEDKIVGKVHPAVQLIRDNRDMFITKRLFATLGGYAVEQIKKARGLNKKIANPISEKKELLDFCYVFNKQGSIPVKQFLAERGLKQKYCGLVNVNCMNNCYSVFYDFAAHSKYEHPKTDEEWDEDDKYVDFYGDTPRNMVSKDVLGFHGIVNDDAESNTVRLSSVPKGIVPICHMSFNPDAYTKHCRDYKDYKEWEKNRNPLRYESNLGKNYDSKNISHCVRLLHMGIEVAQGKGFNPVRTEDRQLLIDIRNHKYEYDEIIKYAEEQKELMNELEKTCDLPDSVDMDKVNELLIEARRLAYTGPGETPVTKEMLLAGGFKEAERPFAESVNESEYFEAEFDYRDNDDFYVTVQLYDDGYCYVHVDDNSFESRAGADYLKYEGLVHLLDNVGVKHKLRKS